MTVDHLAQQAMRLQTMNEWTRLTSYKHMARLHQLWKHFELHACHSQFGTIFTWWSEKTKIDQLDIVLKFIAPNWFKCACGYGPLLLSIWTISDQFFPLYGYGHYYIIQKKTHTDFVWADIWCYLMAVCYERRWSSSMTNQRSIRIVTIGHKPGQIFVFIIRYSSFIHILHRNNVSPIAAFTAIVQLPIDWLYQRKRNNKRWISNYKQMECNLYNLEMEESRENKLALYLHNLKQKKKP